MKLFFLLERVRAPLMRLRAGAGGQEMKRSVLVAVAGVALLLAGCGRDPGPKGDPGAAGVAGAAAVARIIGPELKWNGRFTSALTSACASASY